MKLSKQNIAKLEITPAVIPANGQYPERKGWKLDGYYLNGSDKWATADEVRNGLVGEELSPSKSGKSLVIVGAFSFVQPKTDVLGPLLVKREEVSLTIADLNDLF